jgi:hemoglobin-like flavoprotein
VTNLTEENLMRGYYKYMHQVSEIFSDSYQRVLGREGNSDQFFQMFYDTFISSSEEVAEKFKNTDMEKQRRLLAESFIRMFNFYLQRTPGHYIEKIALSHSRKNLDIAPHLYDLWVDAIIQTVKQMDRQFDENVERTWREVLSVGINFMKSKYDQ